MFSWYKYLIVSLVFSHLGFWSGSLFLIAHFPDLCLLVLFSRTCGPIFLIWFVASGTLAHQFCLNDDPGITMTYLMARSILKTGFDMGRSENNEFLETIAA